MKGLGLSALLWAGLSPAAFAAAPAADMSGQYVPNQAGNMPLTGPASELGGTGSLHAIELLGGSLVVPESPMPSSEAGFLSPPAPGFAPAIPDPEAGARGPESPPSAASARDGLGQMAKELEPQFHSLRKPAAMEGGAAAGREIESIILRRRSAAAAAETPGLPQAAPVSGRFAPPPLSRPYLPNPGDLYKRAFDEAARAAEARGGKASDLSFGEATASLPLRDAEHWKFTFYLPKWGRPGSADSILIDFRSFPGGLSGELDSRAFYYSDAPLPRGRKLEPLSAALFERSVVLSPEGALSAVRARTGLGLRVSLALHLEADAEGGDLWYHFFDESGTVAAVNARTGDFRWTKAPAGAPARETGSSGPILGLLGIMFMLEGLSMDWLPTVFVGAVLALIGALSVWRRFRP